MTSNLNGFISLSLFLLPLTAAILLASVNVRRIESLFHVILPAMVTGSLYLAAADSLKVTTKLAFLSEPLWLSFSRTPIALFILTVVMLWLLILAHTKLRGTGLARSEAVLLFLSLSSGYAAFFSGQFLMRYIALELVGLLTALLALSNFSNSSAYSPSPHPRSNTRPSSGSSARLKCVSKSPSMGWLYRSALASRAAW